MTWLEDHKGKHLYTEAYVWYCDDEVCGCSQARVIEVYKNKAVDAFVFVCIWEGTYFSDFEYGAPEELVAYRKELKQTNPELEATIRWQEGVNYER